MTPTPFWAHAMRMDSGRPRSSMRLRTWTATSISVARRSSVCERSPSPITRLNRPMVASALTGHDADDGAQVDPLLDQVEGPVASFTGDGAYDQAGVYASVAVRHPEAAVIVPPRATAVPSDTAATAPTRRDRHLRHIVEHGRMAWQKASGYTKRARAEATMARWKQVIGDGLRAHADARRATEVDVAVHALNRMLELGRPSYVRIA